MNKFYVQAPLSVLISTIFLLACSRTPDFPRKNETFEKFFDMNISGIPFRAQLAVTEEEKAQGLMFREKLGGNESMIFVYDTPCRVSFWMKNTNIALDLGLFDSDGTLIEIRRLYPHNLNPVNSSSDKIKYCLEINYGWFDKNAVRCGSKLNMELLGKAVNTRKGK